jgi:AcrR family transcriptional regulator
VRRAALEATLAELAESGYSGLSIEAVARRAGVHKTTVYRQWPDRERLITEALLHLSDQELPIPDTGSLRSDLVALAMAIADQITQPQVTALVRTLVAEGDRLPAFRETARSFWSRRFTLTGRRIQQAVHRGELPAETDVSMLLESLIGPLYLRLLITGDELSEEFIVSVVDLILDGILSETR